MEMVLERFQMEEREGRRNREVQQASRARLIHIQTPQGLKERTRGAAAVKWNRATYGYSKGNLWLL